MQKKIEDLETKLNIGKEGSKDRTNPMDKTDIDEQEKKKFAHS